MTRVLTLLLLIGGLSPLTVTAATPAFDVEVLVPGGLHNPWGLAFLPNGDLLITERQGDLRVFRDGALVPEPVAGLPPIQQVRQGGLLGIALHPRFAENRLIYLSYAGAEGGGHSTEVLRGRFDGGRLNGVEVIFQARPRVRGGRHFGGRLLFDDAGYLFVTLGDRGRQPDAQDLQSHSGSLIRLHDDGTVPADNPFNDNPAAAPGIYTYGNRNMQGIALHPQTRAVWTHEHGPQGGDEVNIMRAGVNYGWPVITYGRNYGTGTKIGEGTHKDGMAQPIYKWVPSIGPSGMTFYTGDAFPDWRGDLFVGSLKFALLVRLEVEGETIVGEQRLLENVGRIRDVIAGPDGYVYVITADANGKLLRLVPPR